MEEKVGDPTKAVLMIIVGTAILANVIFIVFPGHQFKFGHWERKTVKIKARAFGFLINGTAGLGMYMVHGESSVLAWSFLISAILWAGFLITPLQHKMTD